MYINAKMIPVETIQQWGDRSGKGNIYRRTVEMVNSGMIYMIHCKTFCKYHNEIPPSTAIKKKKKKVKIWCRQTLLK
jgi:hypothetical protein